MHESQREPDLDPVRFATFICRLYTGRYLSRTEFAVFDVGFTRTTLFVGHTYDLEYTLHDITVHLRNT
jgi:hypothetical protein